jgi:hypothetical protein
MQDIAVVPLLVILPILESGKLSGDPSVLWATLGITTLKALGGLGLLLLGGRLLLRRVFEVSLLVQVVIEALVEEQGQLFIVSLAPAGGSASKLNFGRIRVPFLGSAVYSRSDVIRGRFSNEQVLSFSFLSDRCCVPKHRSLHRPQSADSHRNVVPNAEAGLQRFGKPKLTRKWCVARKTRLQILQHLSLRWSRLQASRPRVWKSLPTIFLWLSWESKTKYQPNNI